MEFMNLEDLEAVDEIKYKVIEKPWGFSKPLVIGSLCSLDMITWIEENNNPATQKFAGLRMLVKSIVLNPRVNSEGQVIGGDRIPESERETWVTKLTKKSSPSNGRLAKECLLLNGMAATGQKIAAIKNDSSEANPGASPSDSPSPSGA